MGLGFLLVQAIHIYAWVKARTGFEPSFRVVFYPAEYFRRMLGIFPIGDPTQYIPDDEARNISRLPHQLYTLAPCFVFHPAESLYHTLGT